jgi:hypothetical protein
LTVAGVLLGAGVFLRLPNVLLPSLVLAPIVLAIVDRRPVGGALRQAGLLAAGVLVGLAAVVALAAALHAGPDIRASVSDALHADGSAHSPTRLLRDIARTVVLSAVHGAGCWLVAALATTAARRSPARRGVLIALAMMATVAAHSFVPRVDWRYSVLGLSAFALVACAVKPRAAADRSTAIIAAWALVLLGTGSASLPWPLLAGLWLALPLAFWRFSDSPALRAVLVTVILVGVVPVRPYLAALVGPRPALWPHELSVVPAAPSLQPLHTSAALATAADELLAVLPTYVHPGDALITTNGTPLVTFLAGAVPFYPHPYIDLVGVARFEAYDAVANWQGPWPVLVRAKFMPTADFAVTQMPGSTFVDTQETREAVASRLVARGYTRAWENALFELWTPPHDHVGR